MGGGASLGTLTQEKYFPEIRTTDKVTQKNHNKEKKMKIGFTFTKWWSET